MLKTSCWFHRLQVNKTGSDLKWYHNYGVQLCRGYSLLWLHAQSLVWYFIQLWPVSGGILSWAAQIEFGTNSTWQGPFHRSSFDVAPFFGGEESTGTWRWARLCHFDLRASEQFLTSFIYHYSLSPRDQEMISIFAEKRSVGSSNANKAFLSGF